MMFGFSRMKVVSMAYNDRPATASRPFDRGRDGFVLGEGAWMLVLEREDRARARGATDLRVDRRLRIDLRRVSPRSDGAGRRRDRARHQRWRSSARAGRAEEIGYVSYHGTSTVLNDAVESRCVRQVFGEHADRLAGSSVKSMIGHPQGASGAAGIVTAALALSRGVPAADDQSERSRPGVRPGLHAEPRAPRRGRSGALQLPRLWIQEQRAGHRPCLAPRRRWPQRSQARRE